MTRADFAAAPGTPLVVDVDGTLVATDLLHEAALQFVAQYPWRAYRLLLWLRRGRAALKTRLADHVEPGITTVPLRPEVLHLIRETQSEGRPVYLASASDHRYIRALAERIGGIAGVFATEPGQNLAGPAKANQLVAAFGAKGYDYIGDMPVDLPVWQSARRTLVVAHSNVFASRLKATFPEAEIVARPRQELRSYIRALRPHQWAKNALLFLPMMAGHRFDPATIWATTLGFIAFCLAASSAYVLNDLLDLPGDRDHPRKMHRPFAAAKLSIPHGSLMGAVTAVMAFTLSLVLPLNFTGVLLIYIVTTLSYSLTLKRRPLIDVVVLGGLYALRVYGGLTASSEPGTPWLLMFCLFLFLSLALVKRCSELVAKRTAGKTDVIGRSYRVEDLQVLLPLAAAAGYGAVLVVALYLSSPDVLQLYAHHNRMWLICPLLVYWISRVLWMSGRGELHDDPTTFALTDRVSWVTVVMAAVIVVMAV